MHSGYTRISQNYYYHIAARCTHDDDRLRMANVSIGKIIPILCNGSRRSYYMIWLQELIRKPIIMLNDDSGHVRNELQKIHTNTSDIISHTSAPLRAWSIIICNARDVPIYKTTTAHTHLRALFASQHAFISHRPSMHCAYVSFSQSYMRRNANM